MKKIALLLIFIFLIAPMAYSVPTVDRWALANIANVKEYGAKGNGTTDDSAAFTRAIAAAGNKILMVPPGTYLLGSNVTSGATVEIWFENGSILNVANTKTFTVSGRIHSTFIPANIGAGTFTYSAASVPIATTGGASTLPSAILGDMLIATGTNTWANLAGNTTTTKKWLTQTGDGANSAAPSWGTIAQADVSGLTTASSPTFIAINADILFNPSPTADTAMGQKAVFTAGASLVFGDVCYMGSDGKMEKADADGIATAQVMAICIATIAEDSTGLFLLKGFIHIHTLAPAWATLGGVVYLSTDAGGYTQSAPSGANDCIVKLGIATVADVLYFNPDSTIVEHN